MDSISAKDFNQSPELSLVVEPSNDVKNFLVEYAGENSSADNNEVTVEMIVELMAKEFPEFVLALAEENWIRGYQQALDDVDTGKKIAEDYANDQQKQH